MAWFRKPSRFLEPATTSYTSSVRIWLSFGRSQHEPHPTTASALPSLKHRREVIRLKSLFGILPDTPQVLINWEMLVVNHQVVGKQAHDTRLVAAMLAHGLTHLLTFDVRDFKRSTEITVVNPQDIEEE